jgi:hypothetical protein
MGIASVTPPGTLSVVPGWHNQTMDISWISIDWSLPGWLYDVYPSAELLEVGAFNINEVAPVTIHPPAPNSSYSLSFYGPSLQCNPANSTQQPFFDYYSEALLNESIWTKSLWLSNPSGQAGGPTDLATFLAFSAFSPGEINCYSYISGNTGLLGPQSIGNQQAVPDQYNNWIENTGVVLGPNFYESTDFGVTYDITTQQFWVLTTNTAIVCILGNASFEANLEYVDGKQTISQTVKDFEPLYMQEGNFPPGESTRTYVGVFTAFTNMLSGNISLALSFDPGPSLLMLEEMTSKVLQSGLAACQDIAPTYWIDYWNKETFSTSDVSEIFNGPSWMCRNETLAPAMEDLFNNITISMLSLNVS